MRALVLTAGLGTRLQPLTLARAKAAAPVDGEPLARRTIRWLVSHAIRDLVLNLHHKPESITAAVGDGADLGARVRYSWESPVLGSAGGPRRALPLLVDPRPSPDGSPVAEDGIFVLVNGDTLTDVDLPRMIRAHRASGAMVTMALIPNPRPDKYGGVLLDDGHAVTGFTRRGSPGRRFTSSAAGGEADVFAISPTACRRNRCSRSIRADARAARVGARLRRRLVVPGHRHAGGPARDVARARGADGRPDRPRWGRDAASIRRRGSRVRCCGTTVTIGAGAEIDECVVADGVPIRPARATRAARSSHAGRRRSPRRCTNGRHLFAKR
jgi:hypothetical protein